jgi:hypothetical protein
MSKNGTTNMNIPNNRSVVARSKPRPTPESTALSPANAHLLAFNDEGGDDSFSLYESATDEYFVEKRSKSNSGITRVNRRVALEIVTRENQRRLRRLLGLMLKERHVGDEYGIKVDTARDTLLWSRMYDTELVAAYQMDDGRTYHRFVSARSDYIILFNQEGWEALDELLEEWDASHRKFFAWADDNWRDFDEMAILDRPLSRDRIPWAREKAGNWPPRKRK